MSSHGNQKRYTSNFIVENILYSNLNKIELFWNNRHVYTYCLTSLSENLLDSHNI